MGLLTKISKVEVIDDGDPSVYYKIRYEDYPWIKAAWFLLGFFVGKLL